MTQQKQLAKQLSKFEKAIIRNFMIVCNYNNNCYWITKQLVKENGKFHLAIAFNNLKK
jgi:hypothetical protein